jgi:hypothetical protein
VRALAPAWRERLVCVCHQGLISKPLSRCWIALLNRCVPHSELDSRLAGFAAGPLLVF